jgi:hypothetical protein
VKRETFQSIARREFTATNGNTLRLDVDPEGNVKFNARKGDHNQSVSVIRAEDVAALVAWLEGMR